MYTNKKMPGVGVGVIIKNEEGKILLLLRNSDSKRADSDMRLEGTWTPPSGKVKYGETIINASIRKVKEETNLDIDDLDIISVADDINEYAHFLTIGLYAHSYSNSIYLKKTKEHIQYGFFDIDNMPNNLCEPSEKIIKNYIENRIYFK